MKLADSAWEAWVRQQPSPSLGRDASSKQETPTEASSCPHTKVSSPQRWLGALDRIDGKGKDGAARRLAPSLSGNQATLKPPTTRMNIEKDNEERRASSPGKPGFSLLLGLGVCLLTFLFFTKGLTGHDSALDSGWNPHPVGQNVPADRNQSALTKMSRSIDAALEPWATNPSRAVGIALHAANAGLLAGTISLSGGGVAVSLATGALFGTHPQGLDSVLRTGRRGELLALALFLLSLACYVRFATVPRAGTYLAALFFYVCSVTTHPVVVLAFLIFAVLDLWPLGRLSASKARRPSPAQLGAEKVPFIAVALMGWAFTLVMGDPRALALAASRSLTDAAGTFGASLAYLLLGTFALEPAATLHQPWSLGYALLGFVSLAFLARLAFQRMASDPWLVIGGLWFFAGTVPELLRVSGDAGAVVAPSGYAGLPGFALAVSATITKLEARWKPGFAALLLASATLLTGFCCARAIPNWESDATIVSKELPGRASNDAFLLAAHSALVAGKSAIALSHLEAGVSRDARSASLHAALSALKFRLGELQSATKHASEALALDPEAIGARLAMADVRFANGEPKGQAAAEATWRALASETRSPRANARLAAIEARRGSRAEAMERYREALSVAPNALDAAAWQAAYNALLEAEAPEP